MSDKYIIRNCPCYIDMPLNNHDKVCRLGDIVKPNHKELYVYCQDCTDCKLKQIVELCEQYKKDFSTTNGVWLLANNITNLLNIQEVE